MNEITPPAPAENNEACGICRKIQRDAKFHAIIAAVLAVFVIFGYFPSPDGPKFEPVEHKEIPASASADTRAAIDKENAEIDKKNAERRDETAKASREWEKKGRDNFLARRMLAQFLAALVAALWAAFFICAYLVVPMLKFLKDFLGGDFAKVVTPLVVLGIAYVVASIIQQSLPVKDLPSHGFVATVMQLVNHVLQPLLGAVTIFTEFVVKNWTVGLVYLAIVVYAIIRKFKQPVQ